MTSGTTGDLHAQTVLPFPPDSPARRIHGEGALLLGGGRALLMQIADPRVAQGVAEHSSYASERWKRLLRTLRPMYAIVFGDEQEAREAAEGINRAHERVRGAGYDALDADLLLWVLATLIDSTFEVHERFLGPVPAHEAEAYYAEMCRVGLLLRIPSECMPADLSAFRNYLERALASLEVSDTAREICGELLRTTAVNAPAMLPLRWLTTGTLPPHLREQYGLAWGPWRERGLRSAQAASRAVLPRIPLSLRKAPWFLMPT